jgi:hypothetical protein
MLGCVPISRRRQRLRAASRPFFHVPAMTSGAPDGNAPEPAWKVRAPLGELPSRDALQRRDERVPQGREVQQLSDVNLA